MVYSVDRKVNAEKLSYLGLWLNASKPETLLKTCEIFVPWEEILISLLCGVKPVSFFLRASWSLVSSLMSENFLYVRDIS